MNLKLGSIKSTPHRFALWPQWLAASELFLMALMIGLTFGWASPYLSKLTRPDSPLPITKEEASWIASLASIARPVGAVLGAIAVSYIGSKSASLLIGIPFAMGWSCYLVVNSVIWIYSAQIFNGIGMGLFFSAFSLYIGEISDPKIRGTLMSFIIQGIMAGNLMGNIMGKYFDLWVFAAISLVPNLIYLCTFFVMPHSPQHLVRRNRMEEAAKSIQWYNGNVDVAIELEALKKFMEAHESLTLGQTLSALHTPINRKSLLMIIIVYGFIQLGGVFSISSYMEIMLTQAQVIVVAPSTAVIIVSLSAFVSSWASIFTNDKLGRTIMLTISTAMLATSMIVWGLNYQLLDLGYENPNLQWMSIISAVIFRSAVAIGVIPCASTLMSEIFAPNIKSLATCICNIISSICMFASNKSFQPIVNVLSVQYVLWVDASIMILIGIYVMIFIPETKGKSLAEIQELLSGGTQIEKER